MIFLISGPKSPRRSQDTAQARGVRLGQSGKQLAVLPLRSLPVPRRPTPFLTRCPLCSPPPGQVWRSIRNDHGFSPLCTGWSRSAAKPRSAAPLSAPYVAYRVLFCDLARLELAYLLAFMCCTFTVARQFSLVIQHRGPTHPMRESPPNEPRRGSNSGNLGSPPRAVLTVNTSSAPARARRAPTLAH